MTTTTPAKKTARRKPASKRAKTPYSKETYIKWHRDMLLMRRFEERCGHLYIQQKFGGPAISISARAILAGMVEAIRPTDRVITAYRDHAHPLALGTDPKVVMASSMAEDRLEQGQGWFHAYVRQGAQPSVATASWADRSASAPASPSPTSTARRTT